MKMVNGRGCDGNVDWSRGNEGIRGIGFPSPTNLLPVRDVRFPNGGHGKLGFAVVAAGVHGASVFLAREERRRTQFMRRVFRG